MAIQQEQLPDRERSLCDVERDVPAVDDERRARMLDRIERATRPGGVSSSSTRKVAAAALVVPALSDTATGAAATSGSTGFALLVKSKIVIGLLAFGAGAGTGASIHAIVATPVAAPTVAPSASVSTVAARPSPPPPRAPIVDAPSAAPSESAAPSSSPVVVSPASPPPSSSTNAASARRERALIDQARIAVLRGDKASALAALRTHAVEFPDGQHREERGTLMRRAEALP